MTDTLELPTKYPSSRGDLIIKEMPHYHLVNAAAKWRRDGGDLRMQQALDEQLAYLDSLPDDAARKAATTPSDKVAPIGHNSGEKPVVVWTRDLIKSRIDDLYEQAQGILDGQPIENDGQAELVAKLKAMIAEAEADAEKLRKAEAKKWDDGKKEVQDFFNPLIADTTNQKGLTTRAIAACQKLLTPWLIKQADELLERERLAREAAEQKIEAAQTLAQAADMTNLADAETVQEAVVEAKQAVRDVRTVEAERPRVAPGMGLRSTLLKDNWTATLTDGDAAVDWACKYHRGELETWLTELATKQAKATKGAPVPGFNVWNDRGAK